MGQINADPKGNWYRLSRKNTISQFYVDKIVKLLFDQGETRSMKNE
jgi:hypothetical protein